MTTLTSIRKIMFSAASIALASSCARAGGSSCYSTQELSEVSLSTGSMWSVASGGGHAFVGTSEGVRVYDITDRTAPQLVGSAGGVGRVSLNGSLLYVTQPGSLDNGVLVYDVSVPSAPSLLADMTAMGTTTAQRLDFAGDLMYLTDYYGGALRIYDMSDPSSPVQVGAYEGLTLPQGLAVHGSHAYVGDLNAAEGFVVIDVSTPSAPQRVGGLPVSEVGGAGVIHIDGDVAWLALHDSGLTGIDISDPTEPEVLVSGFLGSNAETVASVENVVSRDSTLFVSHSQEYRVGKWEVDYREYLMVLDVSTPSNPSTSASTLLSGTAGSNHDLDIYEDSALMMHDGTLRIFDVANQCLCPADLTGDGLLDFFDLSAFLGAFAMGEPAADFNGDGLYNFFDISGFLTAFDAGCP